MFHDLTVSNVRPEGDSAVALTFDIPGAAAETFRFVPGQYLTLRADVEGADLRRSYSIAEGAEGRLCVGVREVPGGVFSTFAQSVKAGDVLRVMAPEGRFVWRGEKRVVLIAAGSGITPMLSIASAVLDAGGEVALIYGNRSTGTIMFRGALEDLKDRYVERFTLMHVLSREPQDVALLNGRVTGEKVVALARAGAVDLAGAEGVFLCGPGAMIEDVSTALEGIVNRDKIHFERFYTEGEARGLWQQVNALAEGVAIDAQANTLWLAAERQGRGLVKLQRQGDQWVCPLAGCVLLAERRFLPTEPFGPGILNREVMPVDFSDLAYWKGWLWSLERNAHQVCRRNALSGQRERCWSFAQSVLVEPYFYPDAPFGLAEALLISEEGIVIGLDNNNRLRPDGDARPWLFHFALPADWQEGVTP